MRKMVLIPFDQYKRQETKSKRESEEGGISMGVGSSSAQTIKDKPLLSMKDKDTSSIPLQYEPEPENNKLEKELILHPIDMKNKRKAESLLKYVEKNMDWNEVGEIITEGGVHTGSHISDLLKHAVTPYKNFNPIGCTAFYLNLAHTPSFLFHPNRRELIGKGYTNELAKISQEENESLPPPGIPDTEKTVDLNNPSIWTNKWRKM